jgi:hypothetical protein
MPSTFTLLLSTGNHYTKGMYCTDSTTDCWYEHCRMGGTIGSNVETMSPALQQAVLRQKYSL